MRLGFEGMAGQKKLRAKKKRNSYEGQPERKLFANPAEIGIGIAMMAGAAIWLVVGLMADRIFVYPFILFVLGVGAFLASRLRSSRSRY